MCARFHISFHFSFSLKKKKQKFKAIRRLPFAPQKSSQNDSPHRIANPDSYRDSRTITNV
jgi:hypothetical protein